MSEASTKRTRRHSEPDERLLGLITAFKVIVADAFGPYAPKAKKDTPPARKDAPKAKTKDRSRPFRNERTADAVFQQCHNGGSDEFDESRRAAYGKKWSHWLSNLPRSAGRLTVDELKAASAFVGRRGLLPSELLVHIEQAIPGATFHALATAFKMSTADIADLRSLFCDHGGKFQVFRYVTGETYEVATREGTAQRNKVAIGHLTITWDPDAKAIRTVERYWVNNRPHTYRGYLLRQEDKLLRIFSISSRHGEVQVIQLSEPVKYTGQVHPAYRDQASRATGMFLDRHEKAFFYAGNIIIQRVDTINTIKSISTYTEEQINIYDANIIGVLKKRREQAYLELSII